MAASNPIDSSIENGLLLACLLIEEGTPAVRKIFDRLVEPDLQTLLNEKKNDMIKYLNGTDEYPKLLNHHQYNMLYVYGYSSEKFDLSLLITLLNILCDPQKVSSYKEDLRNLRIMRNIIYGHITTLRIEEKQFIQEWQNLADVLHRLGVDRHNIKKWKDEKRLGKYKYEIQSLVLNDRSEAEVAIQRFKKMIRENKRKIEENEKVCLRIEKMIADGNSVEQCVIQLHDLERSFAEKFKDVKERVLETKATVQDTLVQVNEISSTQHDIREDIKTCKVIKTVVKEPHTVCMLEKYMASCKSAYKILVCNSPDHENIKDSDLSDLCQHVGAVPWDLVIDLDHESCRTGIYSDTSKALKLKKDIKLITYDETSDIISDIESNILGDKAIWVLANGCAVKKCDSILEKFGGKSKFPIMQMLWNNFRKSPQTKSVFVMVLHQSQEAEDAMKETVSMIMDVIQNCDNTIDEKACVFSQVSLGENSDVYLLDMLDVKVNQVCLSLSCRELVSFLGRINRSLDSIDKYFFPGISGETYLRQSEMTAISTTMELFHRDIGVQDMDPAEIGDRMIDIRSAFHKGNPITPEAIRINEKEQVFVRTNEMGEILEKLEKEMATLERDKGSNRPFYITHEALGGGTTVATVALFEMRNKHPSVKILKLDDSMYDGLQMLYRISKKGLLVLIDCDTVLKNDIESLSKRLEDDEIRAQLLVTRRVPTTETNGETGIYVSGDLDSSHAAAFRKMFEEYGDIEEGTRIFPIGLQAFQFHHSQVIHHIAFCMRQATERQRFVLRLVCILAKYGRRPFSVKLAQAVLDINSDDTHITNTLVYTNDFMLSTRDGDIYLASKCIANPIFQCAFGKDDEAYWMGEFIKDIHDLIDISRDYKDELSHFLYDVFIHEEKAVQEHNINWSPLIQDMMQYLKSADSENVHGTVEGYLRGTIHKLEGTKVHPRMKALLAIFLMDQLQTPKESIALIRAALGLENDQTIGSRTNTNTDTYLLVTYGYLCIQRFHIEKVQTDLSCARKYLEEAIIASQLAEREVYSWFTQTKNKYSAVSFLQDARARLYLLQHYLTLQCGNDSERFRNFLDNESDEFTKTCELKAYIALDKIEFFRSQGKLQDDTTEIILDAHNVRHQILLLNEGLQKTNDRSSIQELIEKLPKHVPCDVGSLIRNPTSSLKRQKHWEELEERELIFIIEEIMKRLGTNELRCYYIDIITAMIHITNRSKDLKHNAINISYALDCANHWVNNNKNDYQAHFMWGVLRFIVALEDETKASGVAYHFKECHRICSEVKSTDSFRLQRYFIGSGAGLAKIVPSVLQARREKDSLQVFTGKLQPNDQVTISEFPGDIQANIIMPEKGEVVLLHRKHIRYNLAFAHDGLKALNLATV